MQAAEGLPDLFPVKSCGGCLAGPVGGAGPGPDGAGAAGLLLPLMQAGPVSWPSLPALMISGRALLLVSVRKKNSSPVQFPLDILYGYDL